jgi:hypothetical protein
MSINNANASNISKQTNFKLKYSSQKKDVYIDTYINFMKKIYQSPWYKYNKPTERIETQLYKYRVALLDHFYYENTNEQ